MIRFILHSILILVVTQLSNVAMGLFMTESQRTEVTYQLTQLNESIRSSKNIDYATPYFSPIIRNTVVSLTRSELPMRIRVMLEGIYKFNNESLTINPETDHTQRYDVWVSSQPDRYFHELCLLLI